MNTEGPDSWCLRARQEEDGPRSPTHSSDSWPERGPGRSPVKCELQQEGHGSGGGVLLSRVAPLRRSRSPCWSAEDVRSDGTLPSTTDVIWDDRHGG